MQTKARMPVLDSWRGTAILLVLIDHGTAAFGCQPAWAAMGQHGVRFSLF
jgi:hypothetical protein